jgi:MFS family permease
MHDQECPENLPDEPVSKPVAEGAYAVLRNGNFFRYLIARFVASLGQQMLVMAIDWELYHRTHSALPLAFVGLSLMIPMIVFTIPAGHMADIFNRKKIILVATLVLGVASVGLTLASYFTAPVYWIYICLFVLGAARTSLWPASAAFVTSLQQRHVSIFLRRRADGLRTCHFTRASDGVGGLCAECPGFDSLLRARGADQTHTQSQSG